MHENGCAKGKRRKGAKGKIITMGFLDFLFGKKEEPTIENKFFGTMTRGKTAGHPDTFYCFRRFAPINDEIEIRFEDDKSGETHRQEAFVRKLEHRYWQMCETFAPHIEREMQKEIEHFPEMKDFKITDFHREFKLSDVVLPNFKTTPLEWIIWFEYNGISSRSGIEGDCKLELSDDTITKIGISLYESEEWDEHLHFR